MGKAVLRNLNEESCRKALGGEWIEEIEACVVDTDIPGQGTGDIRNKNLFVNRQINLISSGEIQEMLQKPGKEESLWEKLKPDEFEAGFPSGVKGKWKD